MDGLSMMSTSSHHHHGDVGDYYPRKLGPKPDVVPSGVTERKLGPPGDHHHHHGDHHHHHHCNKPDMVSVDVLNLQHHHDHHDSEVPMHRKKQEQDTYVLGTIHPFRRTHRSLFGKLSQEFRLVTSDRRSWRILLFGVLNLLCTGCLLMWCNSTNSMALTAYTYLTIFDLFSLITCLISSWVSMKKASQMYSFGFERLEVLAVFASTVLVQLGALFILKESVERLMQQPEIHTGRLLVGTFVALFFNLLTLLSVRNKPFTYVSEAASSSWLQEHVADMSRSVCGIIPGLSSVLLPRMNPFVLVNLAGALALCFTYTLIEINNYTMVDTASAVAIALMTFGTMYPMSVYSGKVLLQTTPSHVIGQLDKLLREVSTLDGVLEVRNEHFWTVGFGSLCGSVHVRVRRDANDQMVLAHVSTRLLSLVSTLTVHVFKDAVSAAPSSHLHLHPSSSSAPSSHLHLHPSSAPPAHAHAAGPPALSSSEGGVYKPPAFHHHHHPAVASPDPLTSTPFKQSSPPPEFSFNSPGRNAQPVLLNAAPHQPHPHRPYGGSGLGAYSGGVPPYAAGALGGPLGANRPMMMMPSSSYRESYRTAPAPLRFGTTGGAGSGTLLLGSQTTTPASQYRQYQP